VFAAVFFNIFPVFAKDELALTESSIGLILLVRAAATAFGFWLFGRIHVWHFKPLLLPLGLALALAFDLAFVFIGSPLGMALGLVLIGLIQAALYSASVFYGASGAPDRERRMTVHEALLTAGQIIGSVGGGLVYQHIAWPAIFMCIAALMLAGIAFEFALLRRRFALR
jgi:predicted MFS family arabinose efflux permease